MTTPLTITRVELTQQSRRTWRELNDENPSRYPVLLHLSRTLDDFERYVLTRSGSIFIVGNDPSTVLVVNTTLEIIRERLDSLTAQINQFATHGQRTRATAQAEDDRLLALEAEINQQLGNPND